jgi:tRNA(Ser,Leu) C12 N-acetylase TAN1
MTAYVCYFDSLGFEWIFNVTAYERKKTMAYLKGEGKIDLPIPRYAILRAQANPQRFPEIWAFESDMDQEDLEMVAKDSPQVLVDAIRKCGQNIFKTYRSESVIV